MEMNNHQKVPASQAVPNSQASSAADRQEGTCRHIQASPTSDSHCNQATGSPVCQPSTLTPGHGQAIAQAWASPANPMGTIQRVGVKRSPSAG